MRFRKLRIAALVLCGIACVLCIALCLRSYSRLEIIAWRTPSRMFVAHSWRGVFEIDSIKGRVVFDDWKWKYISSSPVAYDDWRKARLKLLGVVEPAGDWTIGVPYVVLGVFAALILLRAVRRSQFRWRYSLQTLLIGTTLFALALGTIVWLTR